MWGCVNLVRSELWVSKFWVRHWKSDRNKFVQPDRCMYGLQIPEGYDFRKPALFSPNGPLILKYPGLRCDGNRTHDNERTGAGLDRQICSHISISPGLAVVAL